MTILLQADGLGKRFGGPKAVDGLSLAVEEGELHCLIGPNGAGKCTFFKLILGRYPPTAGTVRFKGEDIARLVPAARLRKGMSVKMQVPGAFPELPLVQNLAIALQSHFRGADLRVHRGEIIGVIGHNGVGKTSTMRCLIGQLPVWKGSIHLRTQDITSLPAEQRAQAGIP